MPGIGPREFDQDTQAVSQPTISLPEYPTEPSAPLTSQSSSTVVDKRKVTAKVVPIVMLIILAAIFSGWLTYSTITKGKEDIAWEQARNGNSMETYQAYLNAYPQGRFVVDAQRARDSIKKEMDTWERAWKGGSVQSYQNYLDNYPQGRFADTARDAQRRIAEAQENAVWEQARNLNSEESYEAYLNTYPNGRFAYEARNIQSRIREENAAWERAQAGDSVLSYQDYLDAYPNGRFVEKARGSIEEIRRRP